MATSSKPIWILCILILSSLSSSYSQSCSNHTFSNNQAFSSCTNLQQLGASLHWTYADSSDTLRVAFRAPQAPTGWVAWGINPSGAKMVGSQALVAFRSSNGSMVAYPTQLSSYAPSMDPGALSFPVSGVAAEFVGDEMVIFATVGPLGNGTKLNHVWQEGSSVLNGVPQAHSTSGENIQSMGTIDLQ